MSNFKIGQKVVCIKGHSYKDDVNGGIDNRAAPSKDEIVTIESTSEYKGNLYLQFEEYPLLDGRVNYFNSAYFRPLVYQDAIADILKLGITEERQDVKVKEKEGVN